MRRAPRQYPSSVTDVWRGAILGSNAAAREKEVAAVIVAGS